MTAQTPDATYRALRASGKSISDATLQTKATHDLSLQIAAEISWMVETGRLMPAFEQDTIATTRWDSGFEQRHHPS